MVSSARYRVPAGDGVTASRLCSASRASPSATAAGSSGANPATSAAASTVNGADEHRHPAQQRPVAGSSRSWLQSSTARTERCRSSARGPPVEHPQLVGQAGREAVQPERGIPRGGQLDRQRHAVEPAQIAATARASPDPAAARRPPPVHEQRDRLRLAAAGQRQRRDRIDPLERHQQPGPARREHRHPRAGRQQPLHERRHPVEHLLAVVQHQQARRSASAASTDSSTPRPGCSPTPSAAATAGRDHARIGDRDQVDEPHAVGERRRPPRAATASASRVLPTPPGPTAVTSRCALHRLGQLGALPRPADERVSGAGSAGAGRDRPARAQARPHAGQSARRSGSPSLRSSEETWTPTVRTEMNSCAAISALLRCSPSSASTSASRAEIAGVDTGHYPLRSPRGRGRYGALSLVLSVVLSVSSPWSSPWCFPW